ncbi:MAG: magnesium transporter [Clostridia bacterium]|nr:magnesium transporter [Clostridia bacterium]
MVEEDSPSEDRDIGQEPDKDNEIDSNTDGPSSFSQKEDNESEVISVQEEQQQILESQFDHLTELLDSRQYSDFVTELESLNPVDAADFFMNLPKKRIPAIFRLLSKDSAADIFAELDSDVQGHIISAMTDHEVTDIVEDLFLDDAVEMVNELPANIVKRIMRSATPSTRAQINKLLAYPEDSAGSVMTAEFISLHKDMTCAQAIDYIRKNGVDKETVYVAYVTDSASVLEGVVSFKELLFASPETPVEDIMEESVVAASTIDDQETVANTIQKYDLLALPIVDKEHRLVGIVTVDDAIDVIKEETTEDIEKMAAIVPTDKPYMKTGVFETWRKRIPWLLLLMVSATFTSTIINHYESAIGTYAILTAFLPMLMDTGGNAGGQASVTIIRSLSLGDIMLKDVLRVVWKELRVAALCGVTIAAACFVKTMLIDFRLVFSFENLRMAFIICLTVFLDIIIAKMIGALLPIGAKRLGFDPAVMASPFITTIVDTLTLLIYFAIASSILPF